MLDLIKVPQVPTLLSRQLTLGLLQVVGNSRCLVLNVLLQII
jgi:hypothetical protein